MNDDRKPEIVDIPAIKKDLETIKEAFEKHLTEPQRQMLRTRQIVRQSKKELERLQEECDRGSISAAEFESKMKEINQVLQLAAGLGIDP